MPSAPDPSARDRLLHAAATLMDAAGGSELSTRAVCELAGVTAPTLYHHFGSKQGLVDAVAQHGLRQYVEPDGDEPLPAAEALRRGWDRHVAFGLDHPRFYALLYGGTRRGEPCAITSPELDRLAALLTAVAAQDGLAVAPGTAALSVHAANVGATLTLIGQPPEAMDPTLSHRLREAVLADLAVPPAGASESDPDPDRSPATAARTLDARLETGSPVLTPGETAILRELLARLSADPPDVVGSPPC